MTMASVSFPLIPESAPFTTEQRAWLNGFFAGWLGVAGPTPLPAGMTVPALAPGLPASPAPALTPSEPVEEFPWRDPALSLDERLVKAEGQPLERRLMASMAQLDCGSCGYVCRTYAEALARGDEKRLTLCSPGGSDTTRALKRLIRETGAAAATNGLVNGQANGHSHEPITDLLAPQAPAWSGANPYEARILRSVNLNGPNSRKQTHHVEIDLSDSGLNYEVGDALGLVPTQCPELVEQVLTAFGTNGRESLRDALMNRLDLASVTDRLLSTLAESASDPAERRALQSLLEDDAPIQGWDVLDLLDAYPSARPAPADFASALDELRPRLYSISSSSKRHPGQVHITVGRVESEFRGRVRKGVASTLLADRLTAGDPVRVFVRKSHGFALPADPHAPILMIGPGTGIAPFRGFLQEREVLGSKGRAWLFFGDQCRATDFLYEEEFRGYQERGILTRLDTAFSRDQEQKVYVQHRMLEAAEEVFAWLEDGASIYVCGDAKRMAADVDRALLEIIARVGRRENPAARAYLANLTASGRYCRDVY